MKSSISKSNLFLKLQIFVSVFVSLLSINIEFCILQLQTEEENFLYLSNPLKILSQREETRGESLCSKYHIWSVIPLWLNWISASATAISLLQIAAEAIWNRLSP